MNKDIRVSVSFKGHRKRKKLRRLLGDRSDSFLIDLWITAAMDCPEGVLTGWDEMDIADAVDWDGDPEVLVSALLETKWLEKNDDGDYIIHDWCEHQGWACNANLRSEAASKNILLRWALKQVKKDEIQDFKDWFMSEYDYKEGHNTVEVLEHYKYYTKVNTNSYGSYTDGNTTLKPEHQAKSKSSSSKPENARQDGLDTDLYQPYTDGNTPSPSPSPSPSPLPSPTPTYKKTPGPDPDEQGPPLPQNSPSGFSSKNKHPYPVFDKSGNGDHQQYFKAINLACENIAELPEKEKVFSPQKWAQTWIKARAHPGAIAETLAGLELFWASAEDPWGVCNKILKTKNGNWNEKEAIAIHNEMKAMNPEKLRGFTHGLFQEMP